LKESIEALLSVATDDVLTLFVVPAFGEDAVFGEQFPLELEENRARYEAREPVHYLLAERTDPPIPASGHLIWAHTEWWERQFRERGLVRLPEVERRLHAVYDPLLPYSVRAFYVFCRDPAKVTERTRALLSTPTALLRARLLSELLRSFALGHIRWRYEGVAMVRSALAEKAPPSLRRLYRRVRGRA
jgi:hypothetical protein